jgi:hypothetical protein
MYPSDTMHELIQLESFEQNAERHIFDSPLPTLEEQFTNLFILLGSLRPFVASGPMQANLSAAFRQLEHLQLSVQAELTPLPF